MQQSCTYGSVRGASGQPASLPRQKTHRHRCRSIVSLQRTGSTPPLVDLSRASPLDLFEQPAMAVTYRVALLCDDSILISRSAFSSEPSR